MYVHAQIHQNCTLVNTHPPEPQNNVPSIWLIRTATRVMFYLSLAFISHPRILRACKTKNKETIMPAPSFDSQILMHTDSCQSDPMAPSSEPFLLIALATTYFNTRPPAVISPRPHPHSNISSSFYFFIQFPSPSSSTSTL
jgi:hypothetical protein